MLLLNTVFTFRPCWHTIATWWDSSQRVLKMMKSKKPSLVSNAEHFPCSSIMMKDVFAT